MAGSCPHQILITGNPRRTRADFVARRRRRRCLITEREAKKEANKNRRNSRCSAPPTLLPRFGDTFVRRKDNLLPPIILEVEVELKGDREQGERGRKEAVTFRPYSWQKGEGEIQRETERDVL